jgi:hypothetical protein
VLHHSSSQPNIQEGVLGFLSRLWLTAGLCLALLSPLAAQQSSRVTLEPNPTLFSVLAVMNACGYNHELAASDALRTAIRKDVAKAVAESEAAAATHREMCQFYRDHQQVDQVRDLSQYISLALSLGGPPQFAPVVKESDLPPDASYVLGLVPLLERYYADVGLGKLWERHLPAYEKHIEQLHQPVAKMLLETDVYLKMPFSGGTGLRFVVYVEPQAAPGQVNARNYGSDYFLVASPSGNSLRLDEVRHTYLHHVLDPLTQRRASQFKRLEPLLLAVKGAPMQEGFKHDMALLTNESLIRAIEARLIPTEGTGKKAREDAEKRRRAAAEGAMKEGFILSHYFFEALKDFEDSPVGMRDAYPNLLREIFVDSERRRAEETEFALQAAPEVVRAAAPRQVLMLDLAEDRLTRGDPRAAHQLAQQALDERHEDPARALFILARAATQSGDMTGARAYFERSLEMAREPRMIAWSHIYLGRIFDLQEKREAALRHYRAALAAGDTTPDTRAAAERGLEQAYQPPAPRR